MAQTIKTVLLFDYDSIHRSLSARAPGAGDMLGARAGVWLEAIEAGEIVDSEDADSSPRRRFQTKRCYADPQTLGKNRGWLTANGMQIVDCSPPSGLSRGAGDVHMVLDALEAVESEPDEILLLSAETDLTPLLLRLRALNQRLGIYLTDETAGSYRAFADSFVDEEGLVAALMQPSEAAVVVGKGSIPRPPRIGVASGGATPGKAAPRGRSSEGVATGAKSVQIPTTPNRVDRETLAALVRRIHEATNVPLFSPRAFADLFRLLAKEVAENGYKFQATAENVTATMNGLGRNVSKRQVGFVIKGLALRGHVFGTDDSPEVLAEAFYEQALYLVENAHLNLTNPERGLVQAWIIGLRQREVSAEMPETRPGSVKASPIVPSVATHPTKTAGRLRSEQTTGAGAPGRSRQKTAANVEPRRRAAASAEPTVPLRAASRPTRVVNEGNQKEEPSFASRVGRNGAAAVAAPRVRPPPAPGLDERREAELEDSILSAIADAVDVLADDPGQAGGGAPTAGDIESPRRGRSEPEVDDSEADEIGDEIQRILSSYSQDR